MPVNRAKNHYLGKEGYQRMNCAQAVINAFKDVFDIDESTIGTYGLYGGGRAPEGLCGAYYAAVDIVKTYNCGSVEELKEYFTKCAGSDKCSAIRETRKLTCLDCVEKCAAYVQQKIY